MATIDSTPTAKNIDNNPDIRLLVSMRFSLLEFWVFMGGAPFKLVLF